MNNSNEMNILRFSRGEYWIIEELVDLYIGIRSLALPKGNLELTFNKSSHGLSDIDLVNTLMDLHDRNLILFKNQNDQDMEICRNEVEHEINIVNESFSDKELKNWKLINDGLYCGLTEKGGKYWEEFSGADWQYFISHDYEDISDNTEDEFEKYELISTNKNYLELYIKSLEFYEINIVDGSIKESILKPWQATYWKKLDVGHKVEFIIKPKPFNKQPSHRPQTPYSIKDIWYSLRM